MSLLVDIAQAAEKAVESHGAEAATSSGVLASLGIDGTLFLFQLINFAIVAAILWFLILKPLTKKMTERQDLIDKSVKNAEEVQKNLQRSELKFQEKVDEAKVEANKILAKAQAEAGELSDKMKAKAKAEIETLVEQTKKSIQEEKVNMVAEIKKETVDLVSACLEKLLSEKYSSTKDKKLIEEMIKKLQK